MTSAKPLGADAVIGNDLHDCLILAAHPDERMMPNGWEPSTTRRTFVLSYDGLTVHPRITLPHPLVRTWTSADGVGYATPLKGNYLYLYSEGTWQRELFSEEDEQIVNIWGVSGRDGNSDTVHLSTERGLFVRQGGQWTQHVLPEPAQKLYSAHGLRTDQIYVCADAALYLWNGHTFEEIENPTGTTPESILVYPHEIVAGYDNLKQWTEADGWRIVDPAIKDIMVLCDAAGQLLVGTYEDGVFERQGTAMVAVTPAFKVLSLQAVGEDVFASNKRETYLRTAGQWRPLPMPSCVAGRLPVDPA